MSPRDAIASRLSAVLRERSEVQLALLFGSQARGSARAASDVDLAVLAHGADLMALAADLARDLGVEVDVVSLEDPAIPLVEELVRDGIVVHEGQPGAGASWRSFALATLETDRPWYARMRDAWLRRVARQGL